MKEYALIICMHMENLHFPEYLDKYREALDKISVKYLNGSWVIRVWQPVEVMSKADLDECGNIRAYF